jgi:pyruvate,water dikinase
VQERVVGTIDVYYLQEMPQEDDGPFLKEETKLIRTIADRLGHFLLHQQMKKVFHEWDTAKLTVGEKRPGEWKTVLAVLRHTDRNLYRKISQQMLNRLCWSGVREAEILLESLGANQRESRESLSADTNRPQRLRPEHFPIEAGEEIFRIAAENMNHDELLNTIQNWIQEDKLGFLVQVVNRNMPLSEVADAVRRYHHLAPDDSEMKSPATKGVTVSLIRRFLSDQLDYIRVAKSYISIRDFYELLPNIIFATESHGKLGGKSAGLYLAKQVVWKARTEIEGLGAVKVPRTWYISSDMLLHFMHYNNLDGIVEQKYKPIDQVRFEYPHIVQTFKNSNFPPEMVNGLSMALDDFGDCPLIVRSSSLLEDRMGAAFSGKYKSLFLANQGSKQKRLDALLDAIAEVYASTFGPDPIEYRAERGLVDFGEEMGIMIQEVVGTRIGDYHFPTFAGVAFSRNEFRWSPRLQREDGLVRVVPGLGTRAVDRTSDDYPILMAPGQPGLRVNVSTEDILRYSPKYLDVIDLKNNQFETVPASQMLGNHGYQIPGISHMVSIFKDGLLRKPHGLNIDFDEDDLVITFEGLFSSSPFLTQVRGMLNVLETELNCPVDIEFAHDGKNLYLLQCRPQNYSADEIAAPIPKDIPQHRLLFSAKKYVSNGRVQDVTHIVYVDPARYTELSSREELLEVGRAVGRLNQVLPKRQFILMGPGRWGSRGDIKLGVSVTYSDINNTAMLIEIARQKGNYVPDVSFGTHFFQDLAEAKIRYLPLYPDDDAVAFNEEFLTGTPNILGQVTREYAHLADTVRLIDVRKATDGLVLNVLMNADLDEAVGVFTRPDIDVTQVVQESFETEPHDSSWRWRYRMAETIASKIDPERFGVKGFYIFGSTKNATAKAGSDIDILVHFEGTKEQRRDLENWLEGWSQSLDEINYLWTGYRTGGLLDVHIITDVDIKEKNSYAAKIDAVTDAARPLAVGTAQGESSE